MRNYSFHVPQERIEPKYFRSNQTFNNINTGRFVRNAILDGMVYGGSEVAPSFLKTCDVIHPLVGSEDYDGNVQSIYGALLDSVNSTTTKAAIRCVVQPWNTTTTWSPGGGSSAANSWIAVKLPEQTLVESYMIASTSANCPLSWKLQGSIDGSTYTDLDTIENSGTWTSAREEKVFSIPEANRGNWLYYRLYITGTNASTMSISTFRLFRPESVCAKGQLLLDASATNHLVMSFMNGFDSVS